MFEFVYVSFVQFTIFFGTEKGWYLFLLKLTGLTCNRKYNLNFIDFMYKNLTKNLTCLQRREFK